MSAGRMPFRARLSVAATGPEVAAATLAVFALVLALTSFRTLPIVAADEIGYLGAARYFAAAAR